MSSPRARVALLVLAALALLGVGLRCLLQPDPGGCSLSSHLHSQGVEPPGKLDLNEATFKELLRLPGLGPVLAQRILLYRERHGPFRSLEELLEVEGIGPSLLERLEGWLKVNSIKGSPGRPLAEAVRWHPLLLLHTVDHLARSGRSPPAYDSGRSPKLTGQLHAFSHEASSGGNFEFESESLAGYVS